MKTVISAQELTVGYDKKSVISDININALRGQIICLLGPNGAGKSTILRTLAGLLAPVSGAVFIKDIDIDRAKKKDIAKKLSLVLTEQPLLSLTTAYELVSMGRTPFTDFLGRLTNEDSKIIMEAMETTGTIHLKDRYFSQLSDGEKQRVMIARALVQEPELIILDEPTSHLDIKHKIEVIRILQKLSNKKNITCILSLHDIDLALKGCQTVMLINEGRVIAHGTPEEVVVSGVINDLYDIKGARYNELCGSVELAGAMRNDVFVVGGNSTGIPIYRAVSRIGLGVCAGVIHSNDMEYEVAVRICSEVVAEQPFEVISHSKLQLAKDIMLKAKAVIDSGFPVGSGNRANLELLKYAIDNKKSIFTMRNKQEFNALMGDFVDNVIYVKDVDLLLKEIRNIKDN